MFVALRLFRLLDFEAATRWTIPVAPFLHRDADNLSHECFGELAHLRVFGDSCCKRTTVAADS